MITKDNHINGHRGRPNCLIALLPIQSNAFFLFPRSVEYLKVEYSYVSALSTQSANLFTP